MARQDVALAFYEPEKSKAIQRKVDREVDHMRAKNDVGKAVIDSGRLLHDHAMQAMLSTAQFDHLMLAAAAQTLNGSYEEVEEAVRQLWAMYQQFVFQCTGQHMASTLRQAETMSVEPQTGILARLGDGIAELQDEVRRLQAGG